MSLSERLPIRPSPFPLNSIKSPSWWITLRHCSSHVHQGGTKTEMHHNRRLPNDRKRTKRTARVRPGRAIGASSKDNFYVLSSIEASFSHMGANNQERKKTRCSVRQPCILCTRSGKSCEFTAAYTRGRLPSIFPEETSQPRAIGSVRIRNTSRPTEEPMRPQTESHQMNLLPSPISDQLVQVPNRECTAESGHLRLPRFDHVESRAQSSRNSPEPSQTDLQGHYVGASSGVSFLLRVQKKLHEKVSFTPNSSIFTFGDAPLPEFDPSFFVLPPKADAQKLVARYFEFAVATHRFLHRPTIEAWLEEFYENLGVMRQKVGARERTALLFMVFAQAKEYMPDVSGSNSVDTR